MKLAAIDIGTNSVKLLVGSVGRGKVRPALERVEVTRLGEGLQKSRRISPEAADRTLERLSEFARLARELGARKVVAAGTRVLRAARNARGFLRRCRRETGLRVRVLTESEEARLAYRGARAAARTPRAVVVDIGGGSMQLTLGTPRGVEWHGGAAIGAVVLTERFLRGDPPRARELAGLRNRIRERLEAPLAGLKAARAGREAELVGVGGTVAALAAVSLRLPRPLPERIHGRRMTARRVAALAGRLAGMSLARRRRVPGIEPGRADIIAAGAAILVEVMRGGGFPALRVSAAGLRHGLLLELASGRRR